TRSKRDWSSDVCSSDLKRCARRHCACRALLTITAASHELEIIVAKPPEKLFGPLQNTSVVVIPKITRRLADQNREVAQHRAVDSGADVVCLDRRRRRRLFLRCRR